MRNRWYVSDHHLWHENIIRFCKRPFADLKEMHESLLTWHNELVKPEDNVSFLGDVTLLRGGPATQEKFLNEIKKYNGHKRLFLGNHDHFPIETYLKAFEKIYATWRCDEGFISSHFPLHPRSITSATANVHGHTHNSPLAYEPVVMTGREYEHEKMPARVVPYINLSVEAINYRPVHLDEILSIIKKCNQ